MLKEAVSVKQTHLFWYPLQVRTNAKQTSRPRIKKPFLIYIPNSLQGRGQWKAETTENVSLNQDSVMDIQGLPQKSNVLLSQDGEGRAHGAEKGLWKKEICC